MPQFDFAVFIPQIFWLLICFGTLYFFSSKVILPRIASILSKRDEVISSDVKSAEEVQARIDEVKDLCEQLRDKSHLNYQKSIEVTLKDCVLNREKSLNKTREAIEKITSESEKRVREFVEKSKSDYNALATNVADLIVKKLFGKNLGFKEDVNVLISKTKN
jgi:F-type H+-transporting ATPase subunit b